MKFLIWALLAYLVYRMFVGKSAEKIAKKEPAAAETFQDPVCGVYIAEADAVVGRLEGKRYHFCSMDCLKKFEEMQQGH
ncbi:YHS domain-containing protein [Geomonas oryzisoli]|uniref:YHS domain-containing protein n=1 Tax=Geomonas oryzisoli TaxID=2847992 RepID=A0ABX8JBE9_9BACT|nr:YHS domain-containing protein [Geomonas oryzisoli]QWV94047.1 YHS domain-containing protein [Geomonas oryzisoli]